MVALVGRGTDFDRAVAVGCAERGAKIALGTVANVQDQEFPLNSIANEIWSIGGDHFAQLMFAWEEDEANAFGQECRDKLGGCDALVINSSLWSRTPFEEMSADAWENTLRATATTPFVLTHVVGREMARNGGGLILVVAPAHADGDVAERAALAALREAIDAVIEAWDERRVRVELLDAPDAAEPASANAVIGLIEAEA